MVEMFHRVGDVPLRLHVDEVDLDQLEDELVVCAISRAQELVVRYSSGEAIAHLLVHVEDIPVLKILAFNGYNLTLSPPAIHTLQST